MKTKLEAELAQTWEEKIIGVLKFWLNYSYTTKHNIRAIARVLHNVSAFNLNAMESKSNLKING